MSDNHPIDMDALAQEVRTESAADRQAERNFRANRQAMAAFQPDLAKAVEGNVSGISWVFGRDGYLTARIGSSWWSGCSVPLLAGRLLLKKLELAGSLGCFLGPSHAGQVRAGLDKIQPAQAIVAIIPEIERLRVFLHCDEFAPEISAGRLFFVSGEDWGAQLAAVFEKFPGLALPQHFIRTALLDDEVMARLSSEAQIIISRETDRRATKMQEILSRAEKRTSTGRVLVLAGSRLSLSDLSNIALRQALISNQSDQSFAPFDPEYPLTSSPLALAETAGEADALVAADLFRADLPGVVGPHTQWITWATRRRIIPASSALPDDRLILADALWRKLALDEGWKPEQIQIAGWPRIVQPRETAAPPGFLAMLADTQAVEMPQRVKDFSSQLLLWESIEEELARNPQALGTDLDWYLDSRMKQLNIGPEGFDRAMFFEKLIEPAYKRGLANFLLKRQIPIRLIGSGWDEIEELKAYAFGAVETVDDLAQALVGCRAVLPAFPRGNAMDGLGLPVVRASELSRVKLVLAAKPQSGRAGSPQLNREMIAKFIVR